MRTQTVQMQYFRVSLYYTCEVLESITSVRRLMPRIITAFNLERRRVVFGGDRRAAASKTPMGWYSVSW